MCSGAKRLVYCLAIVLGFTAMSACSVFRQERPGIFYEATFEVTNDICQRLADPLQSELKLTLESSQIVPGVRCDRWLRAKDHSLVILQLYSDTLFIGVLRNRYGSFLAPNASTRTLADEVVEIFKRTYPTAHLEPTKEYEPWPF
jgi:hypothetical protein